MKFSIVVLGAFGLLFFQNCAPAEFSMEPEKATSLGLPPTQTEIDRALTACDQLTNPNMKTEEVPVFFDNPLDEVGSTPVCSWNQNGNSGINNGYMTARYEQVRNVALPAGATLCNVDFEFTTQAMLYDDHFFFLVNDNVVAASDDFWQNNFLSAQKLQIGGGQTLDLFGFQWSPLVGKGNTTKSNLPPGAAFCLGEKQGLSSCSWPQTEVAGKISMSVAPKVMTALGLLNKSGGIKVSFVTTGDDDITKDCQHEPLSMKLKVRYISP